MSYACPPAASATEARFTVEESDKFQTMLYDVESNLIELTGSKKWSKIKKRSIDDVKESFAILTRKINDDMKDLEAKKLDALKDVQAAYGDQSIFERDQTLKRVILSTKMRLWRKGWQQWNANLRLQSLMLEEIK